MDGMEEFPPPEDDGTYSFDTDSATLTATLDAEEAAAGTAPQHASESDSGSEPSDESEDDMDLCLKLKFGVHGLRGKRKTMEDAHFVEIKVRLIEGLGEDGPTETVRYDGFFGVYDGHGGSVTAAYLAGHLYDNYEKAIANTAGEVDGSPDAIVSALTEAFRKTEQDFMELAALNTIDSGSTAIVAVIVGKTLVVCNVGDSEGVLSHHDGKAKCLSVLHNPKKNSNEEQRIKDVGGKLFHKRVAHPTMPPAMCNIAVSRAFGDLMFKHEMYTNGKPSGLIADADTSETTLATTDEFLILACDGVWDVLTYTAATRFVANALRDTNYDPQLAAEALTQHAYDEGSGDNITVIVVLFEYLPMEEAVESVSENLSDVPVLELGGSKHRVVSTVTNATEDDSATSLSQSMPIIGPGAVLDIPETAERQPHKGPPMFGAHRNLPGARKFQMFAWEDMEYEAMVAEKIGTLEVQQYIQQLIRADPSDVSRIMTPPKSVDPLVWQFEHLRQLTLELNHFAVMLDPVCTQQTCPQMMATEEWLFLCAAHREAQECCAIDYILHTLDGTATLLNSNKHFPSRSVMSADSRQYFQSIARRLYRINAHAYFHHRDVFDVFEAKTHLTERFQYFVKEFKLIAKKMRIIPNNF